MIHPIQSIFYYRKQPTPQISLYVDLDAIQYYLGIKTSTRVSHLIVQQ